MDRDKGKRLLKEKTPPPSLEEVSRVYDRLKTRYTIFSGAKSIGIDTTMLRALEKEQLVTWDRKQKLWRVN